MAEIVTVPADAEGLNPQRDLDKLADDCKDPGPERSALAKDALFATSDH